MIEDHGRGHHDAKETVFTSEKRALEATYSDGLVSTGALNSAAIEKLTEELKLDIPVIKEGY